MAIDINQPVKQGNDMILNYDGKEAVLGSGDDFDKAADAGELISLPPNDNPNGDPNVGDIYDSKQTRDENGKFVKK